jgi:hypothetical protein
MQEPAHQHVESSFNEFVKEFGGELVSELVPNAQFDNADYFFISSPPCTKSDRPAAV